MTTAPKPSALDNGYTCTFDAWNRLVEVCDGETTVGKYEYDALGRRIVKHIDTDSPGDPDGVDTYRHFFYIGWQMVEVRVTDSPSAVADDIQPEYQYVWSGRYVDAPILRDENTDQDGLCDDGPLYYLTDANMNVTALADSSGTVQERYVYDPYGNAAVFDGSWNSQSPAYDNAVLFAGYYRDAETGFYHVRHRMYHPRLGGWLQRDPIGYAAGMNLYEYVCSLPTSLIDPLGLQAASQGQPGSPVRTPDPGLKPSTQKNKDTSNHVPEPKDDCDKLADDLINLAVGVMGAGNPARRLGNDIANLMVPQDYHSRRILGLRFSLLTKGIRSDVKLKYGEGRSIKGIRWRLTMGDQEKKLQGSDAYRHIGAAAALVLKHNNAWARLLVEGASLYDMDQDWTKHGYTLVESEAIRSAESGGNYAGYAAGRILEDLLDGDLTPEGARQKLAELLCGEDQVPSWVWDPYGTPPDYKVPF